MRRPACALFVTVIGGLLVAGPARPAAADEKADVKAALERRIIDPGLPLTEVTEFTDARILPMPDFKTAAEWEGYAARLRQETLDRVVLRGEAEAWRKAPTKAVYLETIPGGPGYAIRKLRYEVVPGMWVPALLYVPEKLEGKAPVALHVNGHDRAGKAAGYKQLRCINLAKRGVIVLNTEWFNMGQLNGDDFAHYKMNLLDLCGTSGLAPFYLAMSRGIDILLEQEHADPTRVAVSGLSGGGWQTITISALDTRVTLSNPVAGYSSFKTRTKYGSDLGDSEQTPVDLGATADYMQLTAMRAPKPTLLTFNAKDNCCFKADHALPPLMEGCGPVYRLYGKEAALRSHVNEDPGDHNFGLDNRQQYYRMVGDFFYSGSKNFDWKEIPSDDEVKKADELAVNLPEENAGFGTVAKKLAASLPRDAALPKDKGAAEAWQQSRRKALAEIVRTKPCDVQATREGEAELAGGKATFWRIRAGGLWTLPATELVRGEPKGTVILIADAGRASASEAVHALLDRNQRVIAVDPFYFGESKIAKYDFLWAMMVATVGERPLGVQSRQVAAIAEWVKKTHGAAPQIVAAGPRTSVVALVASALSPELIAGVELRQSYGSLKEVVEQSLPVTAAPELFCLGLLEQFDIPQLAALTAPRPVRFVGPSDRVRTEATPLKGLYQALGASHDPLAE